MYYKNTSLQTFFWICVHVKVRSIQIKHLSFSRPEFKIVTFKKKIATTNLVSHHWPNASQCHDKIFLKWNCSPNKLKVEFTPRSNSTQDRFTYILFKMKTQLPNSPFLNNIKLIYAFHKHTSMVGVVIWIWFYHKSPWEKGKIIFPFLNVHLLLLYLCTALPAVISLREPARAAPPPPNLVDRAGLAHPRVGHRWANFCLPLGPTSH